MARGGSHYDHFRRGFFFFGHHGFGHDNDDCGHGHDGFAHRGDCEGQFKSVGSMTTTRAFHTATLLNDGHVLIAGGSVDGTENLLSSAELFNPSTKSFALTTGSLQEPLASHTATLLLNGKVLINGGDNGVDTVADCELYDPTSQTFSFTGSMTTPRVLGTATLFVHGPLRGEVLVTGGYDDTGNILNSAELYDPSSENFTATIGSMSVERSQHTATLLPNGKVLIAGGIDNDADSLASAELFDPVTQTFTPTGSMNTARGIHTANLLGNGDVLVAGGIVVTAGTPGPVLASAEIYHNGVFYPADTMHDSREDFTATTMLDGSVLTAGGIDDNGVVLSSADEFERGHFEKSDAMNDARWFHTATLLLNSKLQGAVLVTGGLDETGDAALSSAEIFIGDND